MISVIKLLTELAIEKRHLEDRLIDRSVEIIEHLLCIVLDPKNVNRDHWTSEIYAFINNVPILKSTKKLPTEQFIYDSTYGVWQDNILNNEYFDRQIESICEEENIEIPNDIEMTQNNVDFVCSCYFSWLATHLSEDGVIDDEECYKYLDTVLNTLDKY